MSPYSLAIIGAGFLGLGMFIGLIIGFCFSKELERGKAYVNK